MADYKGVVRFISDTQELALVEETTLVQDQAITATLLGTGNNSTTQFGARLQPIINEDSIVIQIAGSTKAQMEHPLTTSTGRKIFTSTGAGIITSTGLLHTSTGYFNMDNCSAIFGTSFQKTSNNIIDKVNGDIIVTFTSAAKPTLGQAVTVSYTHDYYNTTIDYDRIRLLRADFSSVAVDDVIYYDYSTTSTVAEVVIDLERPGQA